ncbi:hypothetical protein MMC17_009683 [Xylographa soralifera]|nr:hypothetical protein [Xylographa soralifera]
MLVPLISVVLLLVRFVHPALDEIICHDDVRQRSKVFTYIAFDPLYGARQRSNLAAVLRTVLPQFMWLLASPEPLEHPLTVAECLDAVTLIPDSPALAVHDPGTHTRLNLEYTNSQRQRILRYRLDAGFVAGHCAVQIIRRPFPNPATTGLLHADAGAMALVVYPHAREKALAVIEQCLSGNRGQRQYRFGYVGTKSVLNGLDFYYVVAVTLWAVEPMKFPSEHFYDQDGEIEMYSLRDDDTFPFFHAFD